MKKMYIYFKDVFTLSPMAFLTMITFFFLVYLFTYVLLSLSCTM